MISDSRENIDLGDDVGFERIMADTKCWAIDPVILGRHSMEAMPKSLKTDIGSGMTNSQWNRRRRKGCIATPYLGSLRSCVSRIHKVPSTLLTKQGGDRERRSF